MSYNTTEHTDRSNKEILKDMLGDTDPKVDQEAREKLVGARVGLLLKQPFFGNLATRLKLVNSDHWLKTLATDGRNFYYNSRFVNLLTTGELMFGFGHEVLHCVYDHLWDGYRQRDRDPKLYNAACDFCVNGDLVKHNVGTLITTIKVLHDTQYEGLSSEEIYDILLKNLNDVDLDDMCDCMLDDHMQGNDTCEEKGNNDGDSCQCGGRPSISKEDRDAIRDELKEAILNALKNEPNAGNIPGNVKKLIGKLTNPQMDWRELLNMTLTSAIRDDYTWLRPSRRCWHMDAILPGMNPGEEVNIAIAIDTSGSISESMLVDFISEVQGCMESFMAYKIHVFCFDTQIHNPKDFTSDNVATMMEYELGGFGGTDFEPIFKYLKETELDFDRLVVFTDGYPFGSWGDPDYCDTLWIIHGNKTITAPFGTTAYYEIVAEK